MNFVDQLLTSDEPSIHLQISLGVEGAKEARVTDLREQVRRSPRVAALLSERNEDGTIDGHPYRKWSGAHWVLVTLAELGYPVGDNTLVPLREQTLQWLFSDDIRPPIRQLQPVRRASTFSAAGSTNGSGTAA